MTYGKQQAARKLTYPSGSSSFRIAVVSISNFGSWTFPSPDNDGNDALADGAIVPIDEDTAVVLVLDDLDVLPDIVVMVEDDVPVPNVEYCFEL